MSYSQNFLHMCFGDVPEKAIVDAFEASMVLYAEHSFNASTFASRVVTSTESRTWDDPYQQPGGYPIKANIGSGLYYVPDNALYDDTLAEIWFATEEAARLNGFTRAR